MSDERMDGTVEYKRGVGYREEGMKGPRLCMLMTTYHKRSATLQESCHNIVANDKSIDEDPISSVFILTLRSLAPAGLTSHLSVSSPGKFE